MISLLESAFTNQGMEVRGTSLCKATVRLLEELKKWLLEELSKEENLMLTTVIRLGITEKIKAYKAVLDKMDEIQGNIVGLWNIPKRDERKHDD